MLFVTDIKDTQGNHYRKLTFDSFIGSYHCFESFYVNDTTISRNYVERKKLILSFSDGTEKAIAIGKDGKHNKNYYASPLVAMAKTNKFGNIVADFSGNTQITVLVLEDYEIAFAELFDFKFETLKFESKSYYGESKTGVAHKPITKYVVTYRHSIYSLYSRILYYFFELQDQLDTTGLHLDCNKFTADYNIKEEYKEAFKLAFIKSNFLKLPMKDTWKDLDKLLKEVK